MTTKYDKIKYSEIKKSYYVEVGYGNQKRGKNSQEQANSQEMTKFHSNGQEPHKT